MAEEHARNADDWGACPEGALTDMAQRIKSRRQSRLVAKVTGGMAVLLLCVAGGWMIGALVTAPADNDYGGIACSDVQSKMQDYMANELSPEMAAQVRDHLASCPKCDALYRKMKGGGTAGASGPPALPVSVASRGR